MSDLPNHDQDPDPAALDELRRAFADETDETEEADGAGETDDDAGETDDDAGETDDDAVADEAAALVAESASGPIVERVEPESSPIIRIDDYAGSAEIVGPAVTPEYLTRDEHAPDGQDSSEATPVVSATDGGASHTPSDSSDATPVASATDGGASHNPSSSPPAGAVRTVIAISDDELPDPVYVEGSLDADGSGSIVFIEDDDSGDVLAPESERDLRRGIEPRMRERRVAVKRAQSRRRLKRLALVAGVILLAVAGLAVLGSPLFAVREGDVRVVGARYTDEARLAQIIEDAVGTPVLRLDTDAIEEELERIPWVDDAAVRTDFPHGLVIDIRERAAMSTYQGPDGRFRVLDRAGRVLDVLDMHPFAYVLLGGPDAVDLEPGDFAPRGYAAASELAKNLTGSMRGRVTQIEVTADGSRLVVHLDDESAVYFGDARDFLAKLVRLEAVLANGQSCESGLIDVSTADVTRCSVT